MIRLTDVDESNWLEIARLSVSEAQRRFLAPPIGIIARGYVYRDCNARVIGICNDAEMVGVALVRDFIDEPVGYDLQQFIIDERFQNRGYGTAALHVYEKTGFADSGYVDESLPDCVNLICYLR